MKYQKIKEALQALQEGKLVLVMDDKERENEGDLICSAQFATTENVNFMATYAKGLICMPMSESLANRLMLSPMVEDNTDNHERRQNNLFLHKWLFRRQIFHIWLKSCAGHRTIFLQCLFDFGDSFGTEHISKIASLSHRTPQSPSVDDHCSNCKE